MQNWILNRRAFELVERNCTSGLHFSVFIFAIHLTKLIRDTSFTFKLISGFYLEIIATLCKRK